MIVWGGFDYFSIHGSGRRYDPTTNTWTEITSTAAPAPRSNHTAVWTGSEMIIWGGGGTSGDLKDGHRYRPEEDRWTAMASPGSPAARADHTAVWAGGEMIVFGGIARNPFGFGTYLSDTFSFEAGRILYLYQRP
jgi:N-acetylneuraminic acid mutarotase